MALSRGIRTVVELIKITLFSLARWAADKKFSSREVLTRSTIYTAAVALPRESIMESGLRRFPLDWEMLFPAAFMDIMGAMDGNGRVYMEKEFLAVDHLCFILQSVIIINYYILQFLIKI